MKHGDLYMDTMNQNTYFEEIYNENAEFLIKLGMVSYQLDHDRAERVLQDTFLKLFESVKRNGKPCKRGVCTCQITSPDGTLSEKLIRIE